MRSRAVRSWRSTSCSRRSRSSSRSGDLSAQAGNLVARERAPFARAEPCEVEPGVAAAVQAPHRVPDGLEHALDLVLPALVECQLDKARAEAARLRGRRAAVVELDALS